MYTEYLGIKEKPFSITPDPRYLYMSKGHQDALAHLTFGIVESGGFVVLTGEVGTGKTSLCRCLLEQLPKNVEIALILNPVLTRLELVAATCDEFGIDYPAETQSLKQLIDLLNGYLLEAYAEGKHCVLMIDESQNLAPEVLEQVRLLTNLETDKKKLLQIILVGQPELNDLLRRQDMRQLNQRVTARYHLTPLSDTEMRAYIAHRLSVAGLRRMIFSADALKEIYKHSGGVPRLINIICDRCLLAAYATGRLEIGRNIARSAAREVILPGKTADDRRRALRPWAAGIGLAAALAGLVLISQSDFGLLLVDRLKSSVTYRPLPAEDSNLPRQTKTPRDEKPRDEETAAIQPQTAVSSGAKESVEKKLSTGVSASTPSAAATTEAAMAILGADTKNVDSGKATTQAVEKTALHAPSEISLGSAPAAGGPAISLDGDNGLASLPMEGAGLRAALEGLFALWGESYDNLEGETPCSRARSGKLACLLGQDGWSGLRNLNRPALITLDAPDRGRVHALVTGLDGSKLRLRIGDQVYDSTIEALTPHWSGEYLIFWRPPGAFRRVMRDGLKGPDVFWLRLRLAGENGSVSPDSDTFDGNLREAVVAFQESRALKPNGIVDARTLVHLNSLDITRNVPLLHPTTP